MPRRKTPEVAIPLGAYTILQFCKAHGLSKGMYFKLKKQGKTPDEMAVGRRRMISVEAAAAWRRAREAATTDPSQPSG